MSTSIVLIAEKPSVAKTLADWLSRTLKIRASAERGYITVGHYKVSWLYGHVLENFDPHEYDPRYKRWSAADLPIIPDAWQLKVREEVDKTTRKKTGKPDPGTLAQVRVLQDLLRSATEVIGAGDADQEGQLLQDELLLWAGNKAPVKRLWLSATDDISIDRAWKAMKPNTAYAGYYWAALARSHADWLAGINVSRGCTVASRANGGNAVLSFGGVQTPTTALVVLREREIRTFKPVNYFTPFIELATTPGFKASWAPNRETDPRLDAEGRLLDRKIADGIAETAKVSGVATVTKVDAKKGKEHPPLPFSLSSLQEYMSKRHGMGVQDTLKFAQTLYEKKVATYPRTDCEYLPESMHLDAADTLKVMRAGVKELGPAPSRADESLKSRAFDDKKVSAHFAIIPRPTTLAELAGLSSSERLVWVEIAKRYLLQFFPSAEFLTSEIELLCASEPYRVTGKVFTSKGWREAFAAGSTEEDDEEKGAPSLPRVAKGDVLKLKNAGLDSTTTKAPKRFTEGTLIAAMKGIHKFVADPKLKAILRENIGIGTEATRANIIGELFYKEYIALNSAKEIVPTPLGEALFDVLPRQLTAPDMRALWQQAMDDILKSEEAGYLTFMAAQKKWLQDIVLKIPDWFAGKSMNSKAGAKAGGLKTKPTAHTCLKCKGALAHIEGKFGWFFGCQNTACKAVFKDVGGKPVEKASAPAAPLSIGGLSTGDKCPKCGKGTMQTRVCGAHTKTPGKQFLSCSNFFGKGKDKCDHSVWP